MVSPDVDHSGSKEEVTPRIPECRSYEVTEAVDPGVTWTHHDRKIEGLGRRSVRVMWYADISQGDVDPCLMCHVSPGFVRFVDPIGPLTRDMCHPLKGPCVIPPLGMCSLGLLVGGVVGAHLSLPLCLIRHLVQEEPFRSPGLRDSGGLGCSVTDKPKDLKAGATWRDFRLLREFDISGLRGMCTQKEKGAFRAERRTPL
jgi:hypothetical protein